MMASSRCARVYISQNLPHTPRSYTRRKGFNTVKWLSLRLLRLLPKWARTQIKISRSLSLSFAVSSAASAAGLIQCVASSRFCNVNRALRQCCQLQNSWMPCYTKNKQISANSWISLLCTHKQSSKHLLLLCQKKKKKLNLLTRQNCWL